MPAECVFDLESVRELKIPQYITTELKSKSNISLLAQEALILIIDKLVLDHDLKFIVSDIPFFFNKSNEKFFDFNIVEGPSNYLQLIYFATTNDGLKSKILCMIYYFLIQSQHKNEQTLSNLELFFKNNLTENFVTFMLSYDEDFWDSSISNVFLEIIQYIISSSIHCLYLLKVWEFITSFFTENYGNYFLINNKNFDCGGYSDFFEILFDRKLELTQVYKNHCSIDLIETYNTSVEVFSNSISPAARFFTILSVILFAYVKAFNLENELEIILVFSGLVSSLMHILCKEFHKCVEKNETKNSENILLLELCRSFDLLKKNLISHSFKPNSRLMQLCNSFNNTWIYDSIVEWVCANLENDEVSTVQLSETQKLLHAKILQFHCPYIFENEKEDLQTIHEIIIGSDKSHAGSVKVNSGKLFLLYRWAKLNDYEPLIWPAQNYAAPPIELKHYLKKFDRIESQIEALQLLRWEWFKRFSTEEQKILAEKKKRTPIIGQCDESVVEKIRVYLSNTDDNFSNFFNDNESETGF